MAHSPAQFFDRNAPADEPGLSSKLSQNKLATVSSTMSSSLRASVRGLEMIDRHRKQRGWNRQSPIWSDQAFTTVYTLKRFFRGEPVQRETFIHICQAVGVQHWQDIVEGSISAVPIKAWDGVPDVSTFYGRTEELSRLSDWIDRDRCRLIAVLGMGGMGKTTLVAKLSEQIESQFEYSIWRSLRYPIELQFLLDEILLLLPQSAPIPDSIEDKISCLIDRFKQHRILLILDNLETLLSSGDFAGHYLEGYKNYGELLRRIGQESHQSCLLLTSREKTPEIALLEGNTLPVRSLSLAGLGDAAQEILKAKDLSGEAQWKILIQIYRGNPLVLKIISTSIKELFDGDVSAFLKQSMTLITGDLSNFIQQQFDRLSKLEQQISCQLARLKEPVTLTELQQFHAVSPTELCQALESLRRRSLLEKSTAGFTLQPVVLEYVSYLTGKEQEDFM